MLQKLKYITLGIIIGATVVATPSIASEIKEYLLYKADYKIVVNGQQYNSDELPILNYKGVTYTPLKAIGELLNSDVQWNAEVGQVEIGKKDVKEIIVPPPINTNETNKQSDKPINQIELGNQQSSEIKKYLEDNFSTLNTAGGDTKFSFFVTKNVNNPKIEYDFRVSTIFDIDFFNAIKNYPEEIQNTIKSELKNHQEQIAKSVIEIYPNTKFMGRYYHSMPSQPMLKIQSVTNRYFTWTNYTPARDANVRHYADVKVSDFMWYVLGDSEF